MAAFVEIHLFARGNGDLAHNAPYGLKTRGPPDIRTAAADLLNKKSRIVKNELQIEHEPHGTAVGQADLLVSAHDVVALFPPHELVTGRSLGT